MRLVVSILLTLLCIGCKTTSGSYKKEGHYNSELLENTSIQQRGSQSIVDSLLHKYKAKVKGVYRVYGKPDSTGVPPIISEHDYAIDLEGDKQAVNKKDNKSNLEMKDNKKNTAQASLDESGQNETDNRIFRPPEWMYYVLGLILILFVIYKTKKTFSS